MALDLEGMTGGGGEHYFEDKYQMFLSVLLRNLETSD
jgi:hypothetical protein